MAPVDEARLNVRFSLVRRRHVDVTMMFTDIVGSSALLINIGDDRWIEVIEWHDATLRRCFESFGGREVKHRGDGFFAVFADSTQALACAIEIHRTVREAGLFGVPLGLRIGVHTAEVIEVGNDYRGRGVHEAARIAARAHEGEILASKATIATCRAALDASRPRRIRLRGLPEPVSVVSVRSPVIEAGPLSGASDLSGV